MSGVCFVCPSLVIPAWEQTPGQECNPLPASQPFPYPQPSPTSPQALTSAVDAVFMFPSLSPRKKWRFREGNDLTKGIQLEDIKFRSVSGLGTPKYVPPKRAWLQIPRLGLGLGILDPTFVASELAA